MQPFRPSGWFYLALLSLGMGGVKLRTAGDRTGWPLILAGAGVMLGEIRRWYCSRKGPSNPPENNQKGNC